MHLRHHHDRTHSKYLVACACVTFDHVLLSHVWSRIDSLIETDVKRVETHTMVTAPGHTSPHHHITNTMHNVITTHHRTNHPPHFSNITPRWNTLIPFQTFMKESTKICWKFSNTIRSLLTLFPRVAQIQSKNYATKYGNVTEGVRVKPTRRGNG